jgi:serine/threonine-protein kinase HipA
LVALWLRFEFFRDDYLITNVDDHLQNLGFLYDGNGLWRLAPAFDVNPFPDKERESKTWLSQASGPITSLAMLLEEAPYFNLPPAEALRVLGEVTHAVLGWRAEAMSPAVGLKPSELEDFAPAFEHEGLDQAKAAIGRA